MRRIMNYFRTTVFPWNYWFSKLFTKKNKLKIGWCSVFPPIPNGAAVMTEYVINELLKQKRNDLEVYAIPVNNKIDKRKFS